MARPSDKHMTDQELLEKFYSNKEKKWLGVLLERYTLLLLGVCMKYLRDEDLARDSVQQIFLKTVTELEKYRVEYFKSWIYMVAKNHCLMLLRDKPGKHTIEFQEKHAEAGTMPDYRQLAEDDRLYDLLADALKELNTEQQQCVTLFYLEKKSYQQISEHTGYTMMQVKSHIQNGKRNLKIIIDKKLRR